jgi:hypothetical protein
VGQRAIYDERYAGPGYDERSAVPVLTAEATALREAMRRALESVPAAGPVTVLDFAFGTGRVTNDFAKGYSDEFRSAGRGLRIVAYDVSSVGLEKAARSLVKQYDFTETETLKFDPAAENGYHAGTVGRIHEGVTVEVSFVHGSEADDARSVRAVIQAANDGAAFSMTTSWYSGLSHIPTAAGRASFFAMLNAVTDRRGELLVAPSVSGDLVDLQAEWAERLRRGETGDHPVEQPGDVIYETELAQQNFYHVFGTDLADLLEACRGPGQQTWLEAIRMPGPEFRSVQEELENHRRVVEFNDQMRHRPWRPEDYCRVHTAVAIRSGHGPKAGSAPAGPSPAAEGR